jgi:Mg2+/Co2+ transporter CorC
MSGAAGVFLFPTRATFVAGLLATLLAGACSLLLAAVGRGLGAAHGEPVALFLALPVRGLRILARPLGRVVAALGGGAARFTLPRPPLAEMERSLAEYARSQGQGAATSELIHAVFEFREKVARDVMVPRTEVLAVDIATPVPDILRLLAEEGHSRLPVYRDHLDQIVGILHARDLVPLLAHPELILLGDLLRPAHFVPWSKPVEQLLRELQRKKLHMALVVDEYGGVSGLVTIEDVLEEIVGEIADEYDTDEDQTIRREGDRQFAVLALTRVQEFNAFFGTRFSDEEYDTIGGVVMQQFGRLPRRGEAVTIDGIEFRVLRADRRRIDTLRVTTPGPLPAAPGEARVD